MAQAKTEDRPAAAAEPAAARQAPPVIVDDRIDYRPHPKIHLTLAGPVALSNWVGRVGSRRVRVYRGARAVDIPEPVRKAMGASGVAIGTITLAELGLRQLPPEAGRPSTA